MADYTIPDKKDVEKTIKSDFQTAFPMQLILIQTLKLRIFMDDPQIQMLSIIIRINR